MTARDVSADRHRDVLTIWYVRGSTTVSVDSRAVVDETMSVGLLDVELGAGVGDPDDAGDLADGTVHLADDAVGTADQPGAAVVGLGADRGPPVGLDGGDDHDRDEAMTTADDDHFA